ncbi:uncharacterized protein LOC110464601 [Mizuhopecten yessoensis]|uniref:Uncharacterized protein n=1 Tax=Mizuhopecten yessoensis TaxID=6573 RepID=A0A210PTJ3_MIZYE|nr:uncharacterized protein LOC110464601 [Mizuhopecten yessoensis]XP_021375581.1 uncharacterized protein LOC110464601 [Mizuhopecten yessoensis]OWF39819.1 hypothetical protein KP79_PYT20119 [Mizuhopecten yessoensis]
MEKPPNTDILGWYVNKLYKKALDQCLQQSTAVPAQGQVNRGQGQGHSDNFAKSPVCNSMLNGDLSTCTRTIQKDDTYQSRKGQGQKSNFQSHDSRSTHEEVKQPKLIENQNKLSTSQEMCLKQPQSSRMVHENTILSEKRYTVNKNSASYVRESDMTGNYSTGRQHMNETENYYVESSKLERDTVSNLKSNIGFYRHYDSYSHQNLLCSRHKYNESKLSQVVTHDLSYWGRRSQPPIFKETENMRNGRCEMPKYDIQTLKPNGTDLSWFRHSVQPQQTNIHVPISQSSLNKDDHFRCRQHSPNTDRRMINLVVPLHPSVNIERESNNLITCQHSDSVNKGKWLSQSSCSHQHPAKIDSKGSESTSPHQHSVDTNAQFQPSSISNDRLATKTSIDYKKTPTFKSSIFFSLKSNHHNSDQSLLSEQSCIITEHCGNRVEQKSPVVVESTSHSVQPQSHNTCDVHPCNDILEPCEQLKLVKECSSHSPKAVPDQANTENTSTEYLQSIEKEGTNITLDPDESERLKTASGILATPSTSAALEDLVNRLPTSSHKDPSASEIEPENSVAVVPLTDGNLKLHHIRILSGSSPSQNNGADSDSGESCKSGIVIKSGHSNQKRKRSLSLDKKGNKRQSSGATKNRINNPTNTGRTVKGNKKLTNVPGKNSQNKKTDKNSKFKRREKRVADTRYPLRRSCQGNSANVAKSIVDESKTTVKKKKDKNALRTFDKSNKKPHSGMSEHLKQCIGREISILKAHEDQAMSINSDSVCHSIDSKRLSSLAFLDLKDLAQVPEPCKSLENQSVYMSKKHVGGVWNSIVKK